MTFAPSSANRWTIAAPMEREEPVTMATLPANEVDMPCRSPVLFVRSVYKSDCSWNCWRASTVCYILHRTNVRVGHGLTVIDSEILWQLPQSLSNLGKATHFYFRSLPSTLWHPLIHSYSPISNLNWWFWWHVKNTDRERFFLQITLTAKQTGIGTLAHSHDQNETRRFKGAQIWKACGFTEISFVTCWHLDSRCTYIGPRLVSLFRSLHLREHVAIFGTHSLTHPPVLI